MQRLTGAKEQEQSMVTKVSQQPKPGIRACLLWLTKQVKSQQHQKEGSKAECPRNLGGRITPHSLACRLAEWQCRTQGH